MNKYIHRGSTDERARHGKVRCNERNNGDSAPQRRAERSFFGVLIFADGRALVGALTNTTVAPAVVGALTNAVARAM